MRVERFGDAVLYHGDMMEILPTLEPVHAIVTDPPYGINANARRVLDPNGWVDHGDSGEWDSVRPERECFDIIRTKSKHQIIWGGNYFTDYLPPTMQWLVWNKMQRDFSLADCEFAWSSQQKAARMFDLSRAAAIQDNKEHPTQKSLTLMEWCILQLPDDVHSICDPYMGSGTTGVAACKLKRSFVGIEKHEPYFNTACRRIEEASKQESLF